MLPLRARLGGWLLAAVVTLPLFVAVTTSTVSAQDPRQVALGVSMKDYTNLGVLDSFTNSIGGHQPAIWSLWSDWLGNNQAFPTTTAEGLQARGIEPLIFWQPDDPRQLNQPVITYSKIVAGQFDSYIR